MGDNTVSTSIRTLTVPELEGFFAAIRSAWEAPRRTIDVERFALEAFFIEATRVINLAEACQREIDRVQATRFNVLGMIDPDENKLSDILADLLDPRGSHGQGDRFLRLLFDQLRIDPGDFLDCPISVQREAPTHGIQKYRRRIDILIQSGAVVAIENKIDSDEQHDQVKDYLDYLRADSRDWHIPALLIYLTPNGRSPDSLYPQERREFQLKGRLRCWSYSGELRRWLEACHAECEADKVRYFLMDFIAFIDSTLRRQVVLHESEGQE